MIRCMRTRFVTSAALSLFVSLVGCDDDNNTELNCDGASSCASHSDGGLDAGPSPSFDAASTALDGTAGDSSAPELDAESMEDAGVSPDLSSACGTTSAPGVIVDVGHLADITNVYVSGGRLLSVDSLGHWTLWDRATSKQVFAGESSIVESQGRPGSVHLSGTTILAATSATSVDLRRSSDGSLVSSLSIDGGVGTARVSPSGAYAAYFQGSKVDVWTNTGSPVVTVSGGGEGVNGRVTASFISDIDLRIPYTANNTRRFDVTSFETRMTTPTGLYQLDFVAWFQDGQRFLATYNDQLRVYSKDAQEQALLPGSRDAGGYGDYLWTVTSGALNVFHLPSTTAVELPGGPISVGTAVDRPVVLASGTAVVAQPGTRVVQLGDPLIVERPAGDPIATNQPPLGGVARTLFSSDSATGAWATALGPLGTFRTADTFDAPSRTLGCGYVNATAATEDRFAVATRDGRIRTFALNGTVATFNGSYAYNSVSQLEYLSDHSRLLVRSPDTAQLVAVDSVSGTQSWQLSNVIAFAVGSSEARFVTLSCPSDFNCVAQVRDRDAHAIGPTLILNQVTKTNASGAHLALSPNGAFVAVSLESGNSGGNPTTWVYGSGTQTGITNGRALLWLSNTELVTAMLDPTSIIISGADGTELRTLPTNLQLSRAQYIDATRFFSLDANGVINASNGDLNAYGSAGATHVAGRYLVQSAGPRFTFMEWPR
jgi:hypothetical protein